MKTLLPIGLTLIFTILFKLQAVEPSLINYCDQYEDNKIYQLEKLGEYKVSEGRLYKKNEKEKFNIIPNTFDLKKVFAHRGELIALQCDGDLFHFDQSKDIWRKIGTNVYEAKSLRNYLFSISQNDLYVATNLYLIQENSSLFRLIQNGISDIDNSDEGLVFYDLNGEHIIVKAEENSLTINESTIVIDDSPSDYQYKVKSIRMLENFEESFLGGENDIELQVLDTKIHINVPDNLIGKKVLLYSTPKKLLQIRSNGLALPFKIKVKEIDLFEEKTLMSEFKNLNLDQANFLNAKEILKISNSNLEVEIEITKK